MPYLTLSFVEGGTKNPLSKATDSTSKSSIPPHLKPHTLLFLWRRRDQNKSSKSFQAEHFRLKSCFSLNNLIQPRACYSIVYCYIIFTHILANYGEVKTHLFSGCFVVVVVAVVVNIVLGILIVVGLHITRLDTFYKSCHF